IQDLTRIDPVRVFDNGGVEAVDLRPEQRVAVVHLRDGPEGLTADDCVTGGELSLEGGGRLGRVLLLSGLRGVLRRQNAPQERQRRQGQYRGAVRTADRRPPHRSEEHTSELQSRFDLVCRLLLEKKK